MSQSKKSVLTVNVGNRMIKNGINIPLSDAQAKPSIHFGHRVDEYFTIIMVDPDAPSRKNPVYKYWLHQLIINNNEEIAKFHPPSPPKGSGSHRYIIYLFSQSRKLNPRELIFSGQQFAYTNNIDNMPRNNFNLGEFIIQNRLKLVDSVYYKTSNE